MKFEFIWLEDFIALASTGNFTRAAEDRHSSQPAFSRRVRALEEWIGTSLVDRSTQPARLTEVGEWFKSVAVELVARVARLPGEADQLLEALTSDVLARCEAQMHEGKVHFVLAHGHAQVPGSLDGEAYLSAVIGTDRLVPVSKATASGEALHRTGNKAVKNGVPVLSYTEESGMGRVMRAVLGQRLEAMAAHAVFTAHLASVLRSMALDGRGIAWLPQTLIVDDLDAGRLVAAADADLCVDLEIRLYRPRSAVGHITKEFWDAAIRPGTIPGG